MDNCRRSALSGWGQAVTLVRSVLYLASDASSFMTGSDLLIDGGDTAL